MRLDNLMKIWQLSSRAYLEQLSVHWHYLPCGVRLVKELQALGWGAVIWLPKTRDAKFRWFYTSPHRTQVLYFWCLVPTCRACSTALGIADSCERALQYSMKKVLCSVWLLLFTDIGCLFTNGKGRPAVTGGRMLSHACRWEPSYS